MTTELSGFVGRQLITLSTGSLSEPLMCACVHVYVYRLDSNCTVKVTDGALAQQLHPECYYTLFGATRPVRWAAVETLQEGLCTSRSNVVSKVTCTC